MLNNVDQGYLYVPGLGVYMLADLIPKNSGWSDLEPRAINSAGQIVGDGSINNSRHASLLTRQAPIPTIGRYAGIVLALGICVLGIIATRRRSVIAAECLCE